MGEPSIQEARATYACMSQWPAASVLAPYDSDRGDPFNSNFS